MFNFNKIIKFFKYNKINYAIKLFFDQNFFFKFFHILFEKIFIIFRNYLLKNFILNKIKKFINFIKILTLFIFKEIIIFNFIYIIVNLMRLFLKINNYFYFLRKHRIT